MAGEEPARRDRKPTGPAANLKALFLRAPKRTTAALVAVLILVYAVAQSVYVIIAFEGRRWDIPAHVYAAPLELYAGMSLTVTELTSLLEQTGYRELDSVASAGQYHVDANRLTLWTRPFRHWDMLEPSQQLVLTFEDGYITDIRDESHAILSLVRLEPVRLGSLFASHHEDRILVEPDDIPPLLLEALKAVEDRRFDKHSGVDIMAIGRAALVNLRHGEIRQGGSTLTQQLVKSYFLDSRKTFRRKFREAIMSVALELRYGKDELLHAYVNEIYLGQQGARAIHGFGLASEFYFSKPLSQLELHEIALLVAIVRGPSHYDPRRHGERARPRRDRVLETLAEQGIVDEEAAEIAMNEPLGVSQGSRLMSRYQPAFMDMVRQQLANDYPLEELTTKGLRVFTNLDPGVQSLAERELADGLAALDQSGAEADQPLEGAMVVTRPQTGEVIAMVGGRNVEFDGFNRALGAKRPAGSLIKPVVYLAALQTGRYTLASRLEDEPIEIELENGDTWSPENFSKESHGEVPLLRALAESYNQATVRLGMDVGVDSVARLLERLGLPERPAPNPSLLLGAVETTPFEIAEVYGSLANGGFRAPLRAVRSVIDADGEPLLRYPLQLLPVANQGAVQQLNAALVQVVERGTARYARSLLPGELTLAGKTGTSDELRDSWFAGFTDDHLAVVWVGRDDNSSAGLTGSSGALRLWTSLMSNLSHGVSSSPALSDDLEPVWLDYATGLSTYNGCGDAVLVPLPAGSEPPRAAGCRRGLRELGERARRWLERNDR